MSEMEAQRDGTDASVSEEASPPFKPFRHATFTVLWIATVAATMGTWMYNAASGWLMSGLNEDPLMVSLVQVVISLPLLLLALPAGALADIVDKRLFLIMTESSTTIVSGLFTTLVWLDLISPGTLLLFTFLTAATGAL